MSIDDLLKSNLIIGFSEGFSHKYPPHELMNETPPHLWALTRVHPIAQLCVSIRSQIAHAAKRLILNRKDSCNYQVTHDEKRLIANDLTTAARGVSIRPLLHCDHKATATPGSR